MEAQNSLRKKRWNVPNFGESISCRRLDELHWLFQEDGNPLHVAAALGRANFVKEILTRKLDCDLNFNIQGLSALHLASANGRFSVVRGLLESDVGVEVCCLLDKNGLLPISTAAFRCYVLVLKEILGACSEDVVGGLGCLGDRIPTVWKLSSS